MDFATPEQYAAHLATYIASPLKIEKLVMLDFGRAPPLHKIADLRYRVEQSAKKVYSFAVARGDPANDGEDWRPKTFVPQVRRYANSGTRYRPADIVLPEPNGALPPIRCHTDVIHAVAAAFGLTYADIIGSNRRVKHVAARAVAARILMDRGNGLADTGRFMRRDHSTIRNLTHNFDRRCKRFPEMKAVYDRLTAPEAMAA